MKTRSGAFTVIGFDSWVGGSFNFERLVLPFARKGIDLSLVHLGSWGGDPDRPAEEVVGNLKVRDISSFSDASLTGILNTLAPSAVLFLSTDTFAHRAFIRYCRERRIPTINLFHGLIGVQPIATGFKNKVNVKAQLQFVGARVIKALTYVWPTYIRALLKTRASIGEWGRFAQDVLSFALGKYTLVAADDAKTDVCCIFSGADIGFAVRKYRFRESEIIQVGNPDLIRFGLNEDAISTQVSAPIGNRSDVMYIDTGLIYTGTVFQSPKEFIQHIINTRDVLRGQGRRLIFKPHPDHLRTNILSSFSEAGIEICSNENFVPRLQSCCAAIVEPSTAAVVPALMGLPLFLANYGRLSDQTYGAVLLTYPRSALLRDLANFDALITAAAHCDEQQVKQWIESNAGPFPAEQMPDRVADVILKLINDRGNQPAGLMSDQWPEPIDRSSAMAVS